MKRGLSWRVRLCLIAAAVFTPCAVGVQTIRAEPDDGPVYRLWEGPYGDPYCGGACGGPCCRIVPVQITTNTSSTHLFSFPLW